MKKIRRLTGSLLLLVMVCFAAHDYVTGQRDGSSDSITMHTFTKQTGSFCVSAEHQVFHMLALSERADQPLAFDVSSKLHFVYRIHFEDLPIQPPYTPPKTV